MRSSCSSRSNRSRSKRSGWTRPVLVALAILLCVGAVVSPQEDVTDVELERIGSGRTIAIGALASDRSIRRIPIETYVARVLAGEAEPNAPEAELQALAIAIRTYAMFNAGRHRRDSFDLCDTTHCQVMRTSTALTRRAAHATAGQILTWNGLPAEIFYSASCGGRSESAAAIWSGADLPYLTSVEDDVHEEDTEWTYTLRLVEAQRLLARRGFDGGRLRDVSVGSRTSSGRVATLKLSGLEPDVIAGDQFRLLVGARDLKSTAFTVEKDGDQLVFTGRGYGHGVGMCVIGAGRRARRGESVGQILAQYYPGLELRSIDRAGTRVTTETVITTARPATSLVTIRGGSQSSDLQQAATRAHEAMTQVLGTVGVPVTIDVHDTVEGFRQATGKPWWVSASINAATVDLAPLSLVAQREGLDTTLRNAIAHAIMAPELGDRPEWVRVGGARYFSRATPPRPAAANARLKCPADAELTLAISAAAQREAESRAEACFAQGYAGAKDWRKVR